MGVFETQDDQNRADRESIMNEALKELLSALKAEKDAEGKAKLAKVMDSITTTFLVDKKVSEYIERAERGNRRIENELRKLKDGEE